MIKLSGTHYEIGKKLGVIYSKKGLNLANVNNDNNKLKKQLEIYQKYYPNLLEEIRGIAEGSNCDEKTLQSAVLVEEIDHIENQHLPLCTVIGVKNDHGTFIGRNLDASLATEDVSEIIEKNGQGFHKYIGLCDLFTGQQDKHFEFYEYLDAINDQGLYVTITYAYSDQWNYGLTWEHMLRLIIETCSTVHEAIQLFEKVPIANPKNFFIADKDGGMVVIEHDSKEYRIVRPEKNILVKTNHYTHPDMKPRDLVLKVRPTHNTYQRYSETMDKLSSIKDTFTANDIIKVLGDTKSCVSQNEENIKTIWTLALDMTRQKYELFTNITSNNKSRQEINI